MPQANRLSIHRLPYGGLGDGSNFVAHVDTVAQASEKKVFFIRRSSMKGGVHFNCRKIVGVKFQPARLR